ncbi:MAG: BamA/TamA family outer membrane protein, partial [Mucinivorans sp.]
QGQALLHSNVLEVQSPAEVKKGDRLDKSIIEQYIQQRPNRRLLGVGVTLGFYNATDTAKHNGWHRFWSQKVGTAPVILDSALIEKSKHEIDLYLISKGYLNNTITDSIVISPRRKATVHYKVKQNMPYTIAQIDYDISDKFVGALIMQDTSHSLLRVGNIFDRSVFESERRRIVDNLSNMGFWGFGINLITFSVDSTLGGNTVGVRMNVRQRMQTIGTDGRAVYSNNPIYRISEIVVNSDFDPALTIEQSNAVKYDTLELNCISIMYDKKNYIRPQVLTRAIRLSPNDLYDKAALERTYENVRALGYNANVIFEPIASSGSPTVVTIAGDGGDVTTIEQELKCYIQCTPITRQNISAEAEISTTADYYSAALTLGYQNRNIFGGAEVLGLNFRGAYEFMKSRNKNNSFEFSGSVSLTIPRFIFPLSADAQSRFKQAATKITLTYSNQQRPDYRRALFSGSFGYAWTMKNGARFTINPVDLNVVDVPWVDTTFLHSIDNPYLRNSYTSQFIAGVSASYYYTTNSDTKANAFIFRVNADANGSLLRGLTSLFGHPTHSNNESYYRLFGLRFAQYARINFDVSNRVNIGQSSQFAWRFAIAGGYAYGNSSTLPFDRLFFAGGSNSMRGWQVRTLGPGGVALDSLGSYPNQLGDFKLEANVEYRVNVVGGFGMALFFDAGNIWMNSQGEKRPEARFNFNNFYKQIALNTGVGLRYDFGFFMVRLDWGFKLHNPNMPHGHRWFTNLGLSDTQLNFAIGLPF